MFQKILKSLIFIISILFFLFVFKIYFSDKNLLLIEKNRKNTEIDNLKYIENLPVLKNDTNNVISFNSGYEETGKNTLKEIFGNYLNNLCEKSYNNKYFRNKA